MSGSAAGSSQGGAGGGASKGGSQNSDSNTKRTPQQTEDFTEGLLDGKGYINGNNFSFAKTNVNGKDTLISHPGNQKGDQKPDKYKFDPDKGALFIVEDKNYGIENGADNLVRNISNQAIKRIENCLDVDVPKGLMGNSEDGHIDKLHLTFSIDVKGHYLHKDGSPVTVKELEDQNIKQRVVDKVVAAVGPETAKKVGLRIAFVFDKMTNKPLDISGR